MWYLLLHFTPWLCDLTLRPLDFKVTSQVAVAIIRTCTTKFELSNSMSSFRRDRRIDEQTQL